MKREWANRQKLGSNTVFEEIHNGLTIKMVTTLRKDLMTCGLDERIVDVTSRNTEHYDHIPVTAKRVAGDAHIVGLFHAAQFRERPAPDGIIADYFDHLSEDFLIGADASILEFIQTADERPCRLAVKGPEIFGLVTLSDLQKLPVRVALFALVTGLEMTMSEAIARHYPNDKCWLDLLSESRREKLAKQIANSEESDVFVSKVLFTQFCDKRTIILKAMSAHPGKGKLEKDLKEIECLRNNVAHANDYAATLDAAKAVCKLVRRILELQQEFATEIQGPGIGDKT